MPPPPTQTAVPLATAGVRPREGHCQPSHSARGQPAGHLRAQPRWGVGLRAGQKKGQATHLAPLEPTAASGCSPYVMTTPPSSSIFVSRAVASPQPFICSWRVTRPTPARGHLQGVRVT